MAISLQNNSVSKITNYYSVTKTNFTEPSISDITSNAGVAKGTFYLYFKDKYSIRDYLIAKNAKSLFLSAHYALQENPKITSLEDKFIFITDHIIHELEKNKPLLRFISKNLSWGLFEQLINTSLLDDDISGIDIFMNEVKACNIQLKNPEIMCWFKVNHPNYSY